MSSIGMMDGAFFVGRKEIVDWINATLEVNIDKIEDTASVTFSLCVYNNLYFCLYRAQLHANCLI